MNNKLAPVPEIVHFGVNKTVACIPRDWDNEQIMNFANKANPSETGDWELSKVYPDDCNARDGFIHVTLIRCNKL